MLLRELFSEVFNVIGSDSHRFGDIFHFLGGIARCVLVWFLNEHLTEVWHQAVIDTVQLNGGNRPIAEARSVPSYIRFGLLAPLRNARLQI